MSSELELLKQRITELEAENTELRKENTEIPYLRNKLSVSDAEIAELKRSNIEFLRANEEYNERRDAENAKLRAGIVELKSENAELRDRVTKVEQNQLQNDSAEGTQGKGNIIPNNNPYNFNLGAVHHEKPLEEKEMDNFLLEAHKKIVSSEIKQRNKERQADRKKLSKAEQASLNQDQESDTGCSTSEKIPEVSNPVTKISAGAPLPKNSHRKKGAENISQMISDGIQNDSQSQKCILGSSNDILLQQCQISSTVPLLTLAQLFDKATDAEYGAIHANQEEILCWCYYGKKFITQVNETMKNSKIGEKKAKGIIYDKMLEDLSILRKKRSEETGLQLPEITQLTNDKLQEIIEALEGRDNCSLCEHPKELHHMSPKDESSIPEISEKILPEVNAPSTPQITPAKADDNDFTDLKEEDFCGGERM
ncbi:unnamed protein product [Rhizophagus irregularis]|nr:unnamed protein product [Rhizophagus irregularis]